MWGLPYSFSGPLVKPDPKDYTVAYILDKEENMIAYTTALNHNWPAVLLPSSLPSLPLSQDVLPSQKPNPKSLLRAFQQQHLNQHSRIRSSVANTSLALAFPH